MASFNKSQSLRDFQKLIQDVYSLPDDRLYSIWDLLTQQQRFTMRSLKGIRKEDKRKLKLNLLISFSWLMAIANRFHLDVEAGISMSEELEKIYFENCHICHKSPCECTFVSVSRLRALPKITPPSRLQIFPISDFSSVKNLSLQLLLHLKIFSVRKNRILEKFETESGEVIFGRALST